ncbi:long chain fatty acid acyl-CoA ligase, putative [Rhizoctonia solani AG-3 Rhs1AP]|uniref:Long chain fatty acid acyl-CoA ligase, putative n=1 Tax=Rhizoctonia solani AG-3 Rhs1AP TaxID=1086054 RepID=X8J671_9AGAM|nr:long chain fatty acid acyl-CoA ligase, putative [Rhizoctonia solani AG-3 Rhs1AP]
MSNLGLMRAAFRVRQSVVPARPLRYRVYIKGRKYLSHTAYSVQPGTHSIVSGPLDPPLSELTLPNFYRTQILPHHASRPALISRHEHNVRWDFAEFDIQIERMARGLLAASIKPGDRVATIMGNCSSYAVLQWACARIGAILVTMNPAYKIHEILAALNAVTASTLILTPIVRKSSLLQGIFDALPTLVSTSSGQEIHDPMLPSLRRIFEVDNTGDDARFRTELGRRPCAVDLAEIASAQYGPEPQDEAERLLDRVLDRHDVINLQFTRHEPPKYHRLLGLTHRNLLNNGLSIGRCMRLSNKDLVCNVPPLFHCFDEYILGNLAAWVHGAAIVYPSESFSPKAIVQVVSEERCTALHGVPTHFIGVLDELDRVGSSVDMSSLRTGIAAGSPVPIDLMRKLIERLNLHDLTIAYGMTETSPVSFQTTPDDRLEMRVESVGRVQPHVRAKIIDGHGVVVPVGVRGELCISGYLLQKGYWGNPEQTSVVMKSDDEGILWMHTGDQAAMDREGYLKNSVVTKTVRLVKDLIIRGGENLSPVQIENCLTSHPQIVEAAAIAVPDERFGEVVGVWILLRPDATSFSRQEAVDWVKAKMNPQNAPAWVWLIGEAGVPPELPKTASGKVMKNVLRDWANNLLPSGDISLMR